MLRLVAVTYAQYIVGTLLYISMYFVATVIGLTVKKWRRERDWGDRVDSSFDAAQSQIGRITRSQIPQGRVLNDAVAEHSHLQYSKEDSILDRSDPPALKVGGCMWVALAGIRHLHLAGFSKRLSSFHRSSRALKQAEQRSTGVQIKSPAKRLSHHATPVAC